MHLRYQTGKYRENLCVKQTCITLPLSKKTTRICTIMNQILIPYIFSKALLISLIDMIIKCGYFFILPLYCQILITKQSKTIIINTQSMTDRLVSSMENHLLEMIFHNKQCQIAIISKQKEEKWEKYTVNFEADFRKGNYIFGIFQSEGQLRQFMSRPENYTIDFSECSLSLKCLITAHQFSKKVQHKFKLTMEQLSEIQNLRCQVAFLRKKLSNYEKKQKNSSEKRQKNPSTQRKQRINIVSQKNPEKVLKVTQKPKKRFTKSPQANQDSSQQKKQRRFKRQNKRLEEMIQLQKKRRLRKCQNPDSEDQNSKQQIQCKQPSKRKPKASGREDRHDKNEGFLENNHKNVCSQQQKIQPPQIGDIIQLEEKRCRQQKLSQSKIVLQEVLPQKPAPKQSNFQNLQEESSIKSKEQSCQANGHERHHEQDSSSYQKQSQDKSQKNHDRARLDIRPAQEKYQEQQQIIQSESDENKRNYIKKTRIGDKYRIQFKNGDYYVGELKDQKFHGHGKYVSKINGTYDGEWVEGRAEGFGTTIDIEGNRHQGQYKKDLRHGHGKDWYPNGERYEGEFCNSNKEGYGIYFYNNGDRYQGNWKNDMCQGQGRQIYTNGSYYVGTWQQDEKHGEGKLHCTFGVMKQVYEMGRLVASDKNFKPEDE